MKFYQGYCSPPRPRSQREQAQINYCKTHSLPGFLRFFQTISVQPDRLGFCRLNLEEDGLPGKAPFLVKEDTPCFAVWSVPRVLRRSELPCGSAGPRRLPPKIKNSSAFTTIPTIISRIITGQHRVRA